MPHTPKSGDQIKKTKRRGMRAAVTTLVATAALGGTAAVYKANQGGGKPSHKKGELITRTVKAGHSFDYKYPLKSVDETVNSGEGVTYTQTNEGTRVMRVQYLGKSAVISFRVPGHPRVPILENDNGDMFATTSPKMKAEAEKEGFEPAQAVVPLPPGGEVEFQLGLVGDSPQYITLKADKHGGEATVTVTDDPSLLDPSLANSATGNQQISGVTYPWGTQR